MSTVIECPNCGHANQVDARLIATARCESCKERLMEEEAIPAAYTDEEIAAAVAAAPAGVRSGEVDTRSWTSKIGDHEQQVKYVNKGFWSKAKRYASKVPFAREAVAMYYCAMDPATPIASKATAIGALAYWILPVDLIPDFIPVAGFADDASAIFLAFKAISGHITDAHRAKAEQFFAK